jgi:translocation and assembly module TamA
LGWSLFVDVHGAHEAYVSDVSFLQGRTLLRGALPLGQRARLLLRAEFGASLVAEFDELPASQRFFAGGDQSVRGYSYQSLGPTDAEGKVIGGKFLTTYSVEAEYRIAGNWGAAVFADAGGADDDPAPALSRGVGAGLRYRAPIGTVQLDLAHPLDGDEHGVRPHIGIRVGL